MANDIVNFRAEFNDGDVINGMERVIKEVDKGEAAFKELGNEADRALNQAAVGSKELERSIKNSTSEIDKMSRQQQRALQDTSKGFRKLKTDSSSALDAIEERGGKAGAAIARIGRTAGPVGAIVAGVAGAIALAFLDVEENAIKAQRELEGLKAVGNELKDRVFAGLRSVIALALGDLVGYAEDGAKALNGVNGELDEVRQGGRDFFDFQRALTKQNEALVRSEAERIAQLGELRLLAADQNRELMSRIGLTRQAADAEEQLNFGRIARINNEIAVIRQRNAVFGEQEGSLETIAQLENEITKIEGQNRAASIAANQQINALLQERINRTKALTDQIREAEATLAGDAATARLQYDLAREAIERLREEAKLLGAELDFSSLETLAEAEFVRAIDGIKFDNLQTVATETRGLLKSLTDDLSLVGENAAKELEDVPRQLQPIIDEIREALKDAFNINDNQLNFLIESAGIAYQGLTDGILANTEAQIFAQERIIESVRDRVSETQRLLDAERQKQQDGYANNVASYERQLEEQLVAQREAENQRLELEKKAARQRLIINAAEQTSALVLAAAKLTAAEAGKGVIGIGLALAGLATIFSIVSQAKAQAEQFRELPAFRLGTDYVDGMGTSQSDSVIARLSVGERVMTAKGNREIGGRGTSERELIENFKIGKAVTDGYRIDVPDFSDTLARLLSDQQKIAQAQAEQQIQAIERATAKAVDKQTSQILAYWKTLPVKWFDKEGNSVYERHSGNAIERKVFRAEKEDIDPA